MSVLTIRRIAEFIALIGKNVLFVGAPGVGKTKLARRLGEVIGDGIYSIVGYEGLTHRHLLMESVVTSDGGIRYVPGKLTMAIINSWLSLLRKGLPKHLLFDEINRCNVDLVLGNLFTAMDIEHRMSIAVIPRDATKLVIDYLEKNPQMLKLDVDNAKDHLKKLVRELGKGCDGVPMPYSMRIFATMNIYDRAQLYRLGFALQRRFVSLYVPPPTTSIRPKLHEESLKEGIREFGAEKFLDVCDKMLKSVVRQAIRELTMSKRIELGNVVVVDRATIMDLEGVSWDQLGSKIESFEGWEPTKNLLGIVYALADRIGVELGYWVFTDVVKAILVREALSQLGLKMISLDELVDLVLLETIPQLSIVMPRIRYEMLIGAKSRTAELLARFISFVERLLGSSSMSFLMARSLEFELPTEIIESVSQ